MKGGSGSHGKKTVPAKSAAKHGSAKAAPHPVISKSKAKPKSKAKTHPAKAAAKKHKK
jgi:hypothetical protein